MLDWKAAAKRWRKYALKFKGVNRHVFKKLYFIIETKIGTICPSGRQDNRLVTCDVICPICNNKMKIFGNPKDGRVICDHGCTVEDWENLDSDL